MVETSADGYVYLFAAENGRDPVMLYPDARLAGGENFVAAHQPVEIPSSRHPAFQWFRFRGGPATEVVFLVVTTEPLPGVPTDDSLMRYFAAHAKAWQPGEDVWHRVAGLASAARRTSRARALGGEQTEEETTALSREMVLSAGAPQPAVIDVNTGSDARLIVTRIAFTHN
jgi:hypothetical protein